MRVEESRADYSILARREEAGEGWCLLPLKELGSWVGGGTPSKAKPAYWETGSIPWVSPKDMKTERIHDSEDHITEQAVSESTANLIPAGSVLLVTRSGILRHTLPVAVTAVPVTVNQDLKALTPKEGVLPDYVAWALRAHSQEILNACSKQGTTVNSLETARLLRFEIPVAPSDQQKRIVAEIEKQFSRFDEAVANLKRVKANLKRYKAAVLKAAVEGRLVETEAELARREGRSYETGAQLLQRILETRRSQWKGKGKYKEPAAPDTTGLLELPEGWVWATTSQVLREVKDGTHETPKYHESGVPFITQKHVKAAGFVFDDFSRISLHDHKHFFKRSNPERGDILVSMIGVNRGESCIVDTDEVFSIKNVGLFKPDHRTSSVKFIQYYLSSTLGQRLLLRGSKGGAQPFVGLTELRNWPLPIPPYEEQHRIVAEVDRRLSIQREIEAQVDANFQRAERLRQSILSSAFSTENCIDERSWAEINN